MSGARLLLWTATLFALAQFAIAVLGHPVPGWSAAVTLAAVLGVYAFGYAFPRWEMFGDVFSEGPEEERQIALAFVATESLVDLEGVLSVLEEEKLPATFFFSLPALRSTKLEPVVERGHEIGLASSGAGLWRFVKRGPGLKDELERGVAELAKLSKKPVGFMPGTRVYGPALFAAAKRAGVVVVDPRGGSHTRPTKQRDGERGTEPESKPGSVVTFALEDRATPERVQAWAKRIRKQGSSVVRLGEWLG